MGPGPYVDGPGPTGREVLVALQVFGSKFCVRQGTMLDMIDSLTLSTPNKCTPRYSQQMALTPTTPRDRPNLTPQPWGSAGTPNSDRKSRLFGANVTPPAKTYAAASDSRRRAAMQGWHYCPRAGQLTTWAPPDLDYMD